MSDRGARQRFHQEVVGLIPMAGRATRISPLPCSKELYPIGFRSAGKPDGVRPKVAAHYLLEKMKLAGVTKVFIVLRKGKWDIPDYFGDGSILDMHFAYVMMGVPFGPPYSMDQAFPFVENSLVAFGFADILFSPANAYAQLLARQLSVKADVVLGLLPAENPKQMDMVRVGENGRIVDMILKPTRTRLRHAWICALWTPTFTHFMHDHLATLHKHGRTRARNNEVGSQPDLTAGAVIQAAIHAKLRVNSVIFPSGPMWTSERLRISYGPRRTRSKRQSKFGSPPWRRPAHSITPTAVCLRKGDDVVTLQRPEFLYMGGRLRPWEEGVLHVGCEAVNRGLNVFEGLKGYWQQNAQFGIVKLRAHYERLRRSARLLYIPLNVTYEQYTHAVFELVGAMVGPDRDMWVRTTLFVVEGHWGEGTVADLVLTAYHESKELPEPINLGVSTWRRSSDDTLPPRIKTSTNYQVGRLARIEGRARGCQDMIFLNQWGRVAEATGTCVLMARQGAVFTPPATEGALESITVDVIEALAESMGIEFTRRPIDRTELLAADEICLCGTLAGLTLVKSIEGLPLLEGSPTFRALQNRYLQAVRGIDPHPFVDLTTLPSSSST